MQNNILFIILYFILHISEVIAQDNLEKSRKEFNINFRLGSDLVLKEYKNNSYQLDSLYNFLQAKSKSTIDSIVFIGSTSPEGSSTTNKKLIYNRAYNTRVWLRWKFPYTREIPTTLVGAFSGWSEIIEEIKSDNLVPCREEVISILNEYSADPLVMDRIKAISNAAYLYIHRNILPNKRNGAACIIYSKPSEQSVAPTQNVEIIVEQPDTVEIEAKEEVVQRQESIIIMPFKLSPKPLFAIKTDLMLWGGVMPNFKIGTYTPNLGLEFYFANRWSAQFGWAYANWNSFGGNKELYALSAGNLDVKFWTGKRSSYKGLFVGVYGLMGEYDVQEGLKKSLQANTGDFWGAGLELGWLQPIATSWAFEGAVRGGYRSASNKLYDLKGDNYYYNSMTKLNKFDVQLSVSIIYRFIQNRNDR